MNPLSLIPTSWLWPAAAVMGAGLLGLLGVQTLRAEHALRGQAEARTDLANQAASFSEQRLLASRAAAEQDARFRAQEQQVRDEQQEKIDAAEKAAERARADRAIADAASGRLSQRVAALVAAAREAAGNAQAVQPGPPASDPAGVLADVLGRCIARVRLLGTVADGRGTAGQLCEQSYDALTPSTLVNP